jgi:hypothetical protein
LDLRGDLAQDAVAHAATNFRLACEKMRRSSQRT